MNVFQVNKMIDDIKKHQKGRNRVQFMLNCRLPKRTFNYTPQRKCNLRKPSVR
jgi:hypothetical protein